MIFFLQSSNYKIITYVSNKPFSYQSRSFLHQECPRAEQPRYINHSITTIIIVVVIIIITPIEQNK